MGGERGGGGGGFAVRGVDFEGLGKLVGGGRLVEG